MAWTFSSDGETFLHKRRELLSGSESLNCLAWAAIGRSKNDKPGEQSHSFLTFEEGPSITAHAFIQHRGEDLVLSPMSNTQAQQLADTLADKGVQLRIAEGPREAILSFSQQWSDATGDGHKHVMDQGLHELRSVDMPDLAGGRLVRAEAVHRPELSALVEGFVACFPHESMTPDGIAKRIDRFINERRAFLWQDKNEMSVSMAAIVRESPNASSISWVYTPPDHRRQGHAARVVATLSQAQLDAGKSMCNLHTDLSNPTSNSVYRRVGYRQIAEAVRIRIHPESP
jgi:GNAT superfamily N-acetyltransferase